MEWTIFGLFSLSIILFVFSMFQRDRTKDVEKQLENLSIQLMQEMYQLQNKVKLLEEEHMITSNHKLKDYSNISEGPLTRDDVLSMYEDGYSVSDIAAITKRQEIEVEELLAK
ncbi:type II secretory pathway pseudopilin PulG [Evansella vedderi]|uniref:Type II secretory pathway pseudopilin PulG n=1 Tax=Evansella vedderi TaxID=38282 RepID=A0ABT9ZT55_9BACI|nr:hypothetical protein [Evansella vedderi]MDQ0254407.1 type II secretory pathway pseudopilin PulG [Evansella vedderi]